MRLNKLMTAKLYDDDAQKNIAALETIRDVEITGLTSDSREVRKGYLFAALVGAKQDGRVFIKQAVQNGAVAILADEGTVLPEGVSASEVQLIIDAHPRRRFAIMAANFYKVQPEHVVGVTGTNGKTSTVHFAQQLWQLSGLKSVSLGTLGVQGSGYRHDGRMTSPDPVNLHASLADITAAGVTHLAMECSSHGLDQSRMDGVRMTAAGFTNLTRDHLDYHMDMDSYAAAKAHLFGRVLMPGGTAVVNADADYAKLMEETAKKRGQRVLSYGEKGYDIRLKSLTPHLSGQKMVLEVMGKEYSLDLSLIGRFQAYNVMCALGLVIAECLEDRSKIEKIVKLIPYLKAASGRMEAIEGHPKGAAVFVDYAHTSDALEQVLTSIRPHTKGKLITVFGCGGDRDKGKRPMMGRIAEDLSDVAIVTDDNPRGENADAIRNEVVTAAPTLLNIGDRRAAIAKAISEAGQSDVVIIAGKGHEQGQTIMGETYPFDDREEARKAILQL